MSPTNTTQHIKSIHTPVKTSRFTVPHRNSAIFSMEACCTRPYNFFSPRVWGGLALISPLLRCYYPWYSFDKYFQSVLGLNTCLQNQNKRTSNQHTPSVQHSDWSTVRIRHWPQIPENKMAAVSPDAYWEKLFSMTENLRTIYLFNFG